MFGCGDVYVDIATTTQVVVWLCGCVWLFGCGCVVVVWWLCGGCVVVWLFGCVANHTKPQSSTQPHAFTFFASCAKIFLHVCVDTTLA
jgi:hypothetical protein